VHLPILGDRFLLQVARVDAAGVPAGVVDFMVGQDRAMMEHLGESVGTNHRIAVEEMAIDARWVREVRPASRFATRAIHFRPEPGGGVGAPPGKATIVVAEKSLHPDQTIGLVVDRAPAAVALHGNLIGADASELVVRGREDRLGIPATSNVVRSRSGVLPAPPEYRSLVLQNTHPIEITDEGNESAKVVALCKRIAYPSHAKTPRWRRNVRRSDRA
jgi:hypothetical protein